MPVLRTILILIGAGLAWRWLSASRAYQQGRADGYVHGVRMTMAVGAMRARGFGLPDLDPTWPPPVKPN